MNGLDVVNEKVNALEKRVGTLEQDRSEISKLGTIMEMQVSMSKEHDKFLREQSNLLIKIGENLSRLNDVTTKLDSRVGSLEDEVVQGKIESLQDNLDSEKSNSIHIPQLVKTVVATVITSIAIGVIMYLVGNGVWIK